MKQPRLSTFLGAVVTVALLFVPSAKAQSQAAGNVTFTGDFGPYLVEQTSFVWNDAVSLTKGNHTFKFGGSLIRRQLNLFRPIAGKGFFNLCGNGGSNSATGYEVSDLLAGFVCNYQDGVPFGTIGTRSWENGFLCRTTGASRNASP